MRLALAVAVLLAVGASFGLHPEPGARGAADGISRVLNASAAHDCLACLGHVTAVASPLSGIVPEASPASGAALSECSLPFSRLTCRDLSGRSPPAHS